MISGISRQWRNGLGRSRPRANASGGAAQASRLLWSLLVVSTFAFGQAAKKEPAVTVNVGISTAKPGDPIDIPVTLSGSGQAPMSSIVAEISFPKNALHFVRAEAGLAGEASEADVHGVLKDGGDDSLIEVTIAAKRPIKFGILAYLKFRVSTEAKKGSVQLKMRSSKAATPDGQPVQLAKGKDGEVTVFNLDETIPQMGCFFFTH